MIFWSGYRGSNDKSIGSHPNAYDSTSTAASSFRGGTESATLRVGGDTDSESSIIGGGIGESATSGVWIEETRRLREDEGSDASDSESRLLREEEDEVAWGEARDSEVVDSGAY